MAKVERICSKCGQSNPYDRTHCQRCGTSLIAPAARGSQLPAPLSKVSASALIVGATAFIARAGFHLLMRQILPRAAKALTQRAVTPPVEPKPMDSEPEPDYVIRGWRAWSVRRGEQHSSGSEKIEWRIKKNK